MKNIIRFSAIYLLVATLQGCAARETRVTETVVPIRTGGLNGVSATRSWKELRDENVVLQRFDYSCGAGALATLMRYYYGDDVSEELILAGILGPMNDDEVRDRQSNGLSLLDLK